MCKSNIDLPIENDRISNLARKPPPGSSCERQEDVCDLSGKLDYSAASL